MSSPPHLVADGNIRRWCDEDVANDPFDSLDEFDCQFYPKNDHPLHQQPIFGVNQKLNTIVKVWQGNLLSLPADAIVHPTNELFERCTRLTSELYRVCAPALRKELFTQIKYCKTGTVRITKRYVIINLIDVSKRNAHCLFPPPRSYSLASPYIIHTASPRYQHKFHTAAMQSLFNCYFNVLQAARKANFGVLALGSLALPGHGFAEEVAAHLGIRVIRRFLEKFPDAFHSIVLVMDNGHQMQIYKSILKLYFPRSKDEAILQCYRLPVNLGDDHTGQPGVPERAIRIKECPLKVKGDESCFDESNDRLVAILSKSNFARMHTCQDKIRCSRGTKLIRLDEDVDLSRQLLLVGNHILEKQQQQQQQSPTSSAVVLEEIRKQLKFDRLKRNVSLLKRRQQQQLQQEEGNSQTSVDLILRALEKCIYISGKDVAGRPTLTIVGRRFDPKLMCTDTGLYYLIDLFNQVSISGEYILLYFQDGVEPSNIPDESFLNNFFDLLTRKHVARLQTCYIVNFSAWHRFTFWLMRMFDPSLRALLTPKIVHITNRKQLWSIVTKQSIEGLAL